MERTSRAWGYGLALIVVVAVVVWTWWFPRSPEPVAQKNVQTIEVGSKLPLKIGIIAPLTGPMAERFLSDVDAYKRAFSEINTNGGVAGHRLEYVTADSKCTAAGGLSAARSLIDQKAMVLLGGFCVSELEAIVPLLQERKAPLLTTHIGDVAQFDSHGYITSLYPTAASIADWLASTVGKPKTKVALVYENSVDAQGLVVVLEERLRQLKTDYQKVPLVSGNTNYTQETTSVLSYNPDMVVLLVDNPSTLERFAGGFEGKNLPEHVYLVGAAFTPDPQQTAASFFARTSTVTLTNIGNERAERFLAELSGRPGSQQRLVSLSTMTSYDAGQWLAEALRKHVTDNLALDQAVRAVQSMIGVTGKIVITPDTGERKDTGFFTKNVVFGEKK